MEITSKFNNRDFEVWIDHFQYLDLGERHQSVPSGKSFIRGTFDPAQDAYIIDKIHIDPDMLRTDVREELIDEVKLQAHKRDKKILRKKRAAMPIREDRKVRREHIKKLEEEYKLHIIPSWEEDGSEGPMITRDLQTAVWRIADSLARSLKDPQGSTPGDARWTVSGLSHSSWAINHPDIMTDGESPLTLRVKKLPDNRWAAFGQNRLTNLLNTKTLSIKKTPPGGDDWDDIETFASTAATYFQEQKANILALKQAMTPQVKPGAGYAGQQQQQGGPGGEMGGMGGGMGGMMASRRARRRKAADALTSQQAMIALQIQGTGDLEKDKANLRQVALKYHPDRNKNESAEILWKAYNVLKETFIDQGKPLPTTAQAAGQGAGIGGQAAVGQVNKKVNEYVSQAVNGASRLQQGLSASGPKADSRTLVMNINKLNEFVNGAAETVRINLGTQDPKAQGLYQKLRAASSFLSTASGILAKAGPQVSQQALTAAIKNLNGFVQTGNDVLKSMTTKQAGRASATLANLRKAQKVASQIHQACDGERWYLGTRVINDRTGIGVGVGAAGVPPRSLRGSLDGIPVVLEGPGGRMVRARQEGRKRLRLAMRLAAEVAEGLGVDLEAERALKRHQKLVRRVYNHIKNSSRLSGSVRYLARKLGIDYGDLVKVIGQLIVEGKIDLTKKKKFKLLPEPYTPVPGMKDRLSATNSVFGIDRGRSDKRVDQLLSQSVYQLNLNEPADATHRERDIRERPSKLMPDPTQPN